MTTWRLAGPADIPFVYELVATIDPRWWRFSRHGLDPRRLLDSVESVAAAAAIMNDEGQSIGFSILADVSGTSAVGAFEVFALPGHESEVASMVPEIVGAAFAGAPVRKLFYERFDDDPDLLAQMADAWQREVTLPEFALIGGNYVDRHIFGLSREQHERWVDR
ncbi:MAG: hypothetical protein ABI658_31985 [Acidimicrobiales bacterium]